MEWNRVYVFQSNSKGVEWLLIMKHYNKFNHKDRSCEWGVSTPSVTLLLTNIQQVFMKQASEDFKICIFSD